MVIIAEGASDQSLHQLQNALRLPNDFRYLRHAYKQNPRSFYANTSTVQLVENQVLYSDTNRPLKEDYISILRDVYEAEQIPLSFRMPASAVQAINDHIDIRTQGKIRDMVKPTDLFDAQLLLISSIYFKGKWKVSLFLIIGVEF